MSFALSGSAAAPRFVRVVPRAGCAVAALGLAGLVRLVYAVWELRLHAGPRPAGRAEAGEGYHRVPTGIEEQYHYLGDAVLLSLVLCGLAFVLWLQAMRDNADILAPLTQRHSRPWVWFSWLVPGVSFWFPRDVVVDVWRAAAPAGEEPAARGTPWWINAWWLLVVGAFAMLLANASAGDEGRPEADLVYTAFRAVLAADILVVAALLAAILLVLRMTRDQLGRTGG
jgi:hypothetical protein